MKKWRILKIKREGSNGQKDIIGWKKKITNKRKRGDEEEWNKACVCVYQNPILVGILIALSTVVSVKKTGQRRIEQDREG